MTRIRITDLRNLPVIDDQFNYRPIPFAPVTDINDLNTKLEQLVTRINENFTETHDQTEARLGIVLSAFKLIRHAIFDLRDKLKVVNRIMNRNR